MNSPYQGEEMVYMGLSSSYKGEEVVYMGLSSSYKGGGGGIYGAEQLI